MRSSSDCPTGRYRVVVFTGIFTRAILRELNSLSVDNELIRNLPTNDCVEMLQIAHCRNRGSMRMQILTDSTKPSTSFRHAIRLQKSVLAGPEKRLLIWMAERTPEWIHPD